MNREPPPTNALGNGVHLADNSDLRPVSTRAFCGAESGAASVFHRQWPFLVLINRAIGLAFYQLPVKLTIAAYSVAEKRCSGYRPLGFIALSTVRTPTDVY